MTRRDARIMAMQILYTSDFNNIGLEDSLKFYDETKVDDLSLEYCKGVMANISLIDSLITKSLTNYSIDRLNLVDKAIIRLATYELLNKVDKRIVINEALEITKQFSDQGDHKATSFNNKLLETIYKNTLELK